MNSIAINFYYDGVVVAVIIIAKPLHVYNNNNTVIDLYSAIRLYSEALTAGNVYQLY